MEAGAESTQACSSSFSFGMSVSSGAYHMLHVPISLRNLRRKEPATEGCFLDCAVGQRWSEPKLVKAAKSDGVPGVEKSFLDNLKVRYCFSHLWMQSFFMPSNASQQLQ